MESPTPGRQPTIYDVAREAGVSIATVSNVLNKPERVGTATRERVLQVADSLGYVPKSEAATRARASTGRIAVIAPFSAYPSYLRRLVGVMQGIAGRNIELAVFDQDSAATSASPVLATLPVRGHVDGVIVMGQPIDEPTELRLQERGMPVVVVDTDSPLFSAVTIDDIRGGHQAATHLLELGHRHVGYILERQVSDYVSQARRRLDGVKEVFRAAGGEVTVVQCAGSQADGGKAAHELLSGPKPPSAIMAHYDDLALGALQTVRERGLKVGSDVSVMGYDDGPAAEAAGLTTVRQPFEESGTTAVRLLLSTMAGSARSRSMTQLDTTVIARATTGAPRD